MRLQSTDILAEDLRGTKRRKHKNARVFLYCMKQLIIIDFINEIVHANGALSKKGYYDFCQKHKVLDTLQSTRSIFDEVIFVALGFKEDYSDLPKNSPLLGKAQEFGILQIQTWSTNIVDELQPAEKVYYKNRINPFVNKELESCIGEEVYLAGVATDLVVQSAARHLHDKDKRVFVLSDCCAAANDDDHEQALENMRKFCQVITSKEL